MQEVGIDTEIHDPMDLEMQLLADRSGGSSVREIMHRAILVVLSSLVFIAGTNHGAETDPPHGSPPLSRISSSQSTGDDETVRINMMEKDVGEVVDEAQTPLLRPGDNSRSAIKRPMHVLHSIGAFKLAGVDVPATTETSASAASAYVRLGSSDATERHSPIKDISKIVQEEDFPALQEFGGLTRVAHALNTDLDAGISDSEAACRSAQQLPTSAHRFSHLFWEALNNKTILLLSLAAGLSLGFGIMEEGLENGYIDGVIVLITIFVLVIFTVIRKYLQERRAQKKLEKQHFPKGRVGKVHVIRGGEAKCICKSQLVCGDVVLLKKGYQVPADGLFVAGQALELDYGSESYVIDEQNPFLSYGERVINGDARMVVISMDMSTGWSDMMSKASSDPYMKFKLEAHINKLDTCIHYTGLVISILMLTVLFWRYMVGKMDEDNGYRLESKEEPAAMRSFANSFEKIIQESKFTARALTKLLGVSLVGITGGIPFVVSLAIFYYNDKALSGKATEQDSQAVAKMASVTRICTDTFGDFTEDEVEVDMLFIGGEVISCGTTISPDVMEALCDGIGTSVEIPFFHWAKDKLGFRRESMKISERTGENLFEEPCGAFMRGIGESDTTLHFHGPAKEILKKCTQYYDTKGDIAPLDHVAKLLDHANNDMLQKQLRVIAFACKCKCPDTQTLDADHDLVLIALLGLKNRSQVKTRAAVEACRGCGIETIIVSNKKTSVLDNIARQCGVITDSDSEALVLTGEVFREYTDEERFEKVDKIRVMGEALPSDKLLLVKSLRQQGKVVAFLAQRTDEAPAVRGADIGIAVGTWSSEKVREICAIIMWDGSFNVLISMVNSGKCIYYNIQKFLQPFLITTITSNLMNFFGTVAFGDAPLTAVQLVWINLAVVFLGGLALLTTLSRDKAVCLVRDPVSCRISLITAGMVTNILFQVLYQAIFFVILQVKGSLVVMSTSEDIKPMVFNSFILCQFFNIFTARELQKKNFFRGIHRHKEFLVSVAVFIVLQAAFVKVQDIVLYGKSLDPKLWAGGVLFGAGTWLVDWLGKCTSQLFKILVTKLRNTSLT